MDYVVFNAGERAVAGLMLLPEEAKAMGTPPCWLGYIHANDVDAATASVKKAGGAVHRSLPTFLKSAAFPSSPTRRALPSC